MREEGASACRAQAYAHRHLKQAMAWFVRLQSENCGDAERAEFAAWLAANEAHRAAYAEAERTWSALDGLRSTPPPHLAEARAARPRRTRTPSAAVLLLGLAGLLASAGWYEFHAETTLYATVLGERRSVALPDGSRIELNTATRLTVHWSRWRREVELESGEARFSVRHDPDHPLWVRSGPLGIHDVGTRFNVRREPGETRVAVLEGEVELDYGRGAPAERLRAGGWRVFREAGGLLPEQPADAEQVEAWTQGRLVFRRAPLAEVAAELERYHPVRFVFTDAGLRRLTLSGGFDAGDLDPFLRAVEKILPVKATRSGDRVMLSRAVGK